MGKKAVYLLKAWLESSSALGAVGLLHYAVMVETDKYELGAEGGGKIKGKKNIIKKNAYRESRISDKWNLVGATYKTDKDIEDFNDQWIANFPYYDASSDNCQKFALDLIQFLVGASFKMEIPLSSVNAWADRPSSHAISRDWYHQARATTGKAGAQYKIFAAEAEGPSAAAEASELYAGVEASLGRAEGQIAMIGVRLEPNVNTGIGVSRGQLKAKLLGLGATIGGKGIGLHTPLGSIGFGSF